MRVAVLIGAMFYFALSAPALSYSDQVLTGTWRLVHASAVSSRGDRIDAPFGANPKGFLTYTREGRMSAMISHGARTPLSIADRIAAPAEERAEAFATFFAYGGRYSLSGNKVIHHVEISSVENWVNTDLVREFTFTGGQLTLRTPSILVNGIAQTTELIFERVKL
jgi:Lipocalin-like domain